MNGGWDLVEPALDVLDDVFYIYDTDGRLAQWNRRLNVVFGLTDDELAGMTPPEFFVAADRWSRRRSANSSRRGRPRSRREPTPPAAGRSSS